MEYKGGAYSIMYCSAEHLGSYACMDNSNLLTNGIIPTFSVKLGPHIFFNYYVTPFPYDSLNDQNRKIDHFEVDARETSKLMYNPTRLTHFLGSKKDTKR